MRYIRFIAMLVSVLIATKCIAQKKQKIAYEFPEAMADPIRAQYIQLADKGYALYQITCAKCHGAKNKGAIPDFTVEQLEAYQIRVSNAKHETELQENSLTAEELSLITVFFTYKKKSKPSKHKLEKPEPVKVKSAAH
jgi:hypothetical protein